MRQYHIVRMRVFLTFAGTRRVHPYKVIEIQTEDKRKQQAPARAMSKCSTRRTSSATLSGNSRMAVHKELEQELGDYSFEGEKFPRVRVRSYVEDTRALARIAGRGDQPARARPSRRLISSTPTPISTRPARDADTRHHRPGLGIVAGERKAWLTGATGASGWRVVEPYVIRSILCKQGGGGLPYSKEAATKS